jgi:surface carbohydrate biosynthesis protein (TIGR04326 family)
MRFLELRLFCDPRVYRETEGEAAPLPDKLCLNGSVALSLMKESQYPNQKIARIEALRYKSLAGRYGSEEKKKKLSGQTLLVVTGSIDRETQFQLKLLDEAAAMGGLKNYEKIIIKSHPDLPTDSLLSILKPRFQYTLVSQPLNKLWSATDVIYCSNSTTAPIEAGYLGIPAIITGPENCFNLNPLYGLSSVNYVTSSKMLCKELENPTEIHIPEDYFYLDNKMTLWKNLLLDEKVE